MINYVNTVLVGGTQLANNANLTSISSVQDLTAGKVFMVDKNGTLIKTEAAARAADAIKLGVVLPSTSNYITPAGAAATVKNITMCNLIPRDSIVSFNAFEYVAASEDVVTLKFLANTAAVKGNRYVLRLIYRDLYEHPGQFTHTYEVVAAGTSMKTDVIEKLKVLINKDPRRRVAATSAASTITTSNDGWKLTLTALPKTDNDGKESINIYTQVMLDARMYYTNPSATGFASKNKYPIDAITIEKTAGSPGKGNPKLIRDREQAALGHKGILSRTHFPVIKPELLVDLSKSYDGFTIEFEPTHRNAEDNFSKTKQSVEVYFDNTVEYSDSLIKVLLTAFLNPTNNLLTAANIKVDTTLKKTVSGNDVTLGVASAG